MSDATLELYDPRNGDLALQVKAFEETVDLTARVNSFVICWIQQGSGEFWADLARHGYGPGMVLFLNPYQAFRLVPDQRTRGLVIQFHANFLCIETHNAEVGCNGVLFNDVYGVPAIQLDKGHEREWSEIVTNIREEIRASGLAHSELLLSYLKILLVKATRLKVEQQQVEREKRAKKPPVLEELRHLIEKHYRTKHSASEYAALLHLAPKSLAKIVKTHMGKTLTELIRERILNHAKWEILHTEKPIKQIAAEIGFDDELYFSRLFKRAAGLSPTAFREFETTIRGGSNLSPHFRKLARK